MEEGCLKPYIGAVEVAGLAHHGEMSGAMFSICEEGGSGIRNFEKDDGGGWKLGDERTGQPRLSVLLNALVTYMQVKRAELGLRKGVSCN